MGMIQKSIHTNEINGSEIIEINQVRITSNTDGTIRYTLIKIYSKTHTIQVNW